eukprot:137713-Rhodomonas_salina.3
MKRCCVRWPCSSIRQVSTRDAEAAYVTVSTRDTVAANFSTRLAAAAYTRSVLAIGALDLVDDLLALQHRLLHHMRAHCLHACTRARPFQYRLRAHRSHACTPQHYPRAHNFRISVPGTV